MKKETQKKVEQRGRCLEELLCDTSVPVSDPKRHRRLLNLMRANEPGPLTGVRP